MSGPKVLRIVTREEIEAICRQHLADFEAAAEECLRIAGTEDESLLAKSIAERRAHLQELLAKEFWLDLQKQAAQMQEFFRAEAKRLEAAAVLATLSRRQRRQRLLAAIDSLKRIAPGQDLDLLARRSESAQTEELAGLESELAQLVRTRSEAGPQRGEDARLQELADRLRLGSTAEPQRFLAIEPALASRLEKIENALAELEVLGGASGSKDFAERAAALVNENPERQAAFGDSLLFELQAELSRQRRFQAVRQQLLAAKIRLGSIAGSEAADLRLRLDSALADPAHPETEALLAEKDRFLTTVHEEAAANSRRQAILEGLAALGYEVREGMATALVEQGRVVLRKRDSADYGLEIGFPPHSPRFQARVVASNQPNEARSAQRDRDQEALWCTEAARLQELLAANGDLLEIEKSLPPGETPLKAVQLGPREETRAEMRAPSASRFAKS